MHILLVERGRGPLYALAPAMARLDLDVCHASDAVGALRYLTRTDLVAVLLAPEGLPLDGCLDVLAAARRAHPALPLVWFGTPVDFGEQAPDHVVDPGAGTDGLFDCAERAARRAHYPDDVVSLVRDSAITVLSESFGIRTFAEGPSLVPRRPADTPLGAILAFRGRTIAGALVVAGHPHHLGQVLRGIVPGSTAPGIRELEDLAGEMANQILGRIKRHFLDRGHGFLTPAPIFFRGGPLEVRTRSGLPSLRIALSEARGTVALQLGFETFAPDPDEPGGGAAPGEGELLFL